MNLLNKIILLITDSYLYIILSIPFILLVLISFFYVCSFLSYLCREKLLLNHQNISKLLVAFILSFIFIIAISITPFEYLILSFLILLFMLISYSYSINVKIFLYTSILLILNLVFFCIKNSDTLIQCKINDINISVFYWVYIIILGLFLIISSILYLKDDKKDVKDNNKSKNLFSERKYDLERIIEYLGQYNLIGLNADWGNGKSFFFFFLRKQEKDKFFFINISVLTIKKEKIESYVVNEICNILENNRIFTWSSKRIKGLFQQSFFHDLGELFFGFGSYAEAIKKLKTEVMKLERPIIITFEDIDRVSDKDIIHKIFALADVINDEKMKIIFQYEEKRLLQILEEKKDYIEKYIQHTISLTTIPFETMIKKFLSKQKYSSLTKEDFYFLISQIYIPFDLQKLLNINWNLQLNIHNYNIRKFEIFFDDIIQDLKTERFKDIYKYKQKIILFYFIKHFDYAFFECLKDDISFTDTKMFFFNNNMYSIVDLLKRVYNKKLNNNDTEMILKNDTNRIRMFYYILFGFDSSIIIRNIEYEEKKTKATTIAEDLTEILNQDIKELKAQEKNDKINRMIKNLISSGKSENTDFEIAVKKMNEVLNLPKEQQENEYEKLSKRMYNGDFEKSGNQTIFKIGISSIFSLFQAYLCFEKNSEQWKKLIDFFIKPDTKIDSQLIQTLNYCKIDDKKVFLHIINRFSELEIIGNLNKTISYKNFIITYFNAIKTHGFFISTKIRYLSKDMIDRRDMKSFFVNLVIPDCLNDFEKLKKLSNNKDIQSEIIILEKFVKHNLNILKNEVELQEHTPKLKISYTTSDDFIVKKSEEYKKMKLTKEQLQKILDEQYLKGEISMYEYRCYMINVFGEKL